MTGIFIVNKPEGITSFGVVSKMKRITGEKKIGHSGTLDPMARGVMTILVGGCTRFCEILPDHNKEYIAGIKLGITTDTLDITGKILEEKTVNVTEEQFRKAVSEFVGEIEQVPPMYSAVSVNGQRLYELARKGQTIERPSRKVTIFYSEVLSADESKGEYVIKTGCSSGTYIRTLINDIGEKLGCGAVMTSLERTKANGFSTDEALTLEELGNLAECGQLDTVIHPIDKALSAYPEIFVTGPQSTRFSNGGELFTERLQEHYDNGLYRVISPEGQFLGIGEIDGSETMKVKRVFRSGE